MGFQSPALSRAKSTTVRSACRGVPPSLPVLRLPLSPDGLAYRLGNSPVRSSTGQIGDHLLVAIDDEFPDYVSAVGEVICPGCGELTRARDRLFLVGLGPGTASLPASAEFDAERVGGTTGKYGATVDETGSESQFVAERLERASVIWIRSANSHTGPRQ